MRNTLSILLIALLLINWNTCFGQQDDNDESKKELNALYFSLGTAVLWHGASVTYEKALKYNKFKKNVSSFAKLGAGYYTWWDWSPEYGGPWIFSHYGWLVGKDKHYFEASAGLMYIPKGDLNRQYLSGTIGYRYTKRKFIFRANISFPEALNLGAGFKF
jgi:hypothetical protein